MCYIALCVLYYIDKKNMAYRHFSWLFLDVDEGFHTFISFLLWKCLASIDFKPFETIPVFIDRLLLCLTKTSSKPLQSKVCDISIIITPQLFTLSMSVECPLVVPAPSCQSLISHCHLWLIFCMILCHLHRSFSSYCIECSQSSPCNLAICW